MSRHVAGASDADMTIIIQFNHFLIKVENSFWWMEVEIEFDASTDS